jgi:predicted ArsR family transcriptional regulator
MDSKDFAKQLGSLAALDEPVRRKLYLYVVGRDGDVSRDEAARATRVSRALAAFHLDKLVKAGLLEATFRRLSARVGPGAGRPSKLYRRASTRFDVSLPQRRYELAAHVLAQTLAETGTEVGLEALRSAARDWGSRLAQDASLGTRRGLPLNRASRALQVCGFEPRRTPDGEVVLRNCPFDSLRANSRELICAMNLALIEGLLAGLSLQGVHARLAPRAGMCCVALRNRPDEE